MNFRRLLRTSLAGLKAHKSRSLLTILGIVIGITAIILVMAIGQGAEDLILAQIQGLGSRTIVVIPGREPKGPTDPSIVETILSDSLKEREFEALKRKENVPQARSVMPLVFGTESVSYQNETFRPVVLGVSPLATKIFDLSPAAGLFFRDEDVRSRADVIVIGSKVKDELFGLSEALGERVKLKGKNFLVIGVLPKKGQVSFFNFDEAAVVPYTTAQQSIFGIKHFNRLVVEAESEEAIAPTVKDIEITLRNLHGITDPDKDDFFIETQADLAARVGTITNILTLLLVSIAPVQHIYLHFL